MTLVVSHTQLVVFFKQLVAHILDLPVIQTQLVVFLSNGMLTWLSLIGLLGLD